MRTLFFFFVGVFFMTLSINAQDNLNDYKYVSISKRYDFQKLEDSYQINSLTNFLFEKKGFQTYYSDEKTPDEVQVNPCLGLKVKLVDESTMLKTSMFIELYNCHNKLVLKTEIGESKEKDYKKGYHEAIRLAFKTIEDFPYQYSDDKRIVDILVLPEKKTVAFKQESLQKEPVKVEEIVIPEKSEMASMTDQKYQEKVAVIAAYSNEINPKSIVGNFSTANKTISIVQQGNQYTISDHQNNIIGILYRTSKTTYFIVKWLQSDDNLPKLVFLDENGDLLIDGNQTVLTYKRH